MSPSPDPRARGVVGADLGAVRIVAWVGTPVAVGASTSARGVPVVAVAATGPDALVLLGLDGTIRARWALGHPPLDVAVSVDGTVQVVGPDLLATTLDGDLVAVRDARAPIGPVAGLAWDSAGGAWWTEPAGEGGGSVLRHRAPGSTDIRTVVTWPEPLGPVAVHPPSAVRAPATDGSAATDEVRVVVATERGAVLVRDAPGAEAVVRELRAHSSGAVGHPAFDANGHVWLPITTSAAIVVFDAEGHQREELWLATGSEPTTVCFTPDGHALIGTAQGRLLAHPAHDFEQPRPASGANPGAAPDHTRRTRP